MYTPRTMGAGKQIKESLSKHQLPTILLLLLLISSYIFIGFTSDFYDYAHYHAAAKAYLEGQSPYDLQVLNQFSSAQLSLLFVYPPTSIYLFAPLALLDFEVSKIIYLLLKLLALLILISQWRIFVNRTISSCLSTSKDNFIFFTIVFLGLNSCLLNDLQTGNPAIFETLFIWLGINAIVDNRPWKAIIYLVCGALIKGFALPFLLLLLLLNNRKRVGYFLASVVLYCIPHSIVFFSGQHLYEDFYRNTLFIHTDIFANASLRVFFLIIGSPNLYYATLLLTLSYSIWIFYLSFHNYRQVEDKTTSVNINNQAVLILFSTLVFAICTPRLKHYSFSIFLPAIFVCAQSLRGYLRMAFIALSIFPAMVFVVLLNYSVGSLVLYNFAPFLPITLAFVILGRLSSDKPESIVKLEKMD